VIESNVTGRAGELAVHTWPNLAARWLAVLVHGYGEHLGRYEHVATALGEAGVLVVGGDLVGHGVRRANGRSSPTSTRWSPTCTR